MPHRISQILNFLRIGFWKVGRAEYYVVSLFIFIDGCLEIGYLYRSNNLRAIATHIWIMYRVMDLGQNQSVLSYGSYICNYENNREYNNTAFHLQGVGIMFSLAILSKNITYYYYLHFLHCYHVALYVIASL